MVYKRNTNSIFFFYEKEVTIRLYLVSTCHSQGKTSMIQMVFDDCNPTPNKCQTEACGSPSPLLGPCQRRSRFPRR